MALYKDGNPVSGLNSIPRLTLAQYNAQNAKPEFWVRTDAPESYKKLSADQVSYDSNNTVKDKIDSMETDYVYNLTLINGWAGNVEVNVSTKNKVVAIEGYLDATNATSTTFCNADTNPLNCYNNKLLPVSGQSLGIKANQAQDYTIGFDNTGGWHAVISQKLTIAIVNVYARA